MKKIYINFYLILIIYISYFNVISQNSPPPNTNSNSPKCDYLSANMIVTTDANNRYIKADGCPGWNWSYQTTPNVARYQNYSIILPLNPILSTDKIWVGIKGVNGTINLSPVMGPIGISYNGLAIYGNADAEKRDAYIYEGASFDKCGGHADMSSTFHLHAEVASGCGYNIIQGQHSPIFAMMADGIPLFGQQGDNGQLPTDLDECGGHIDKTYPFYHYHLPANKSFPYTISCLRGCVFSNNGNQQLTQYVKTQATCNKNSTQYDYSTLKTILTNYSTTNGPINVNGSQSTVVSDTNNVQPKNNTYGLNIQFNFLVLVLIYFIQF